MDFINFPEIDVILLDGAETPLRSEHQKPWRLLPFYVLVNQKDVRGRVETRERDYLVGNPGSYLIPRDVPHKLTWIDDHQPQPESIWCHFNVILHRSIDFLSFFEIPPTFDPELSLQLRKICLAIFSTESASLRNTLEIKKLEFELIGTILSGCREKPGVQERLSEIDRIAPALEYIRKHFGKDFHLADAAAAASLSPSRFSAVFRKIMKNSPFAWRQEFRLAHAYGLLYAGDGVSIKAISEQLGFCDEFHFAKSFKAHYGITPAALLHKIRTEGRW